MPPSLVSMEVVSSLEELPFQSNSPTIIIILVTLLAILIGIWKHRVSPAKKRNLPPGNLGLPLIGESISFIQAHKQNKISEWVEKRRIEHGPIFKTSIIGSNMMFVTGEAGNRFMFSGRDNGIVAHLPTSALGILGKNNIFVLSGSRHKLVRGGIASILNPERIQRYVSQMDSLAKQQLFQVIIRTPLGLRRLKIAFLVSSLLRSVECKLGLIQWIYTFT